jgi:hypothetical protein
VIDKKAPWKLLLNCANRGGWEDANGSDTTLRDDDIEEKLVLGKGSLAAQHPKEKWWIGIQKSCGGGWRALSGEFRKEMGIDEGKKERESVLVIGLNVGMGKCVEMRGLFRWG